MFREMRMPERALSREECIRILETQLRGVLSVIGENGYPYASPVDHYYNAEDGKIYFHSGKEGHRIDAMKADSRACFCVYDEGFLREGDWALNISSVIVFGRIEVLDDHEKGLEIVRRLSHKFTQDDGFIEEVIRQAGPFTLVYALVPEHMTGKIVNES